MPYYAWNPQKNLKLKQERGISFEEVVVALENGQLLDRIKHPNQLKYPHQYIFIINIHQYVYLVPYIDDIKKQWLFLKTIIPSRDMTKKYLIKPK